MGTEKLTVACALVGDKWDEIWVHRLKKMVSEHCSIPFRFVCVTDRPIAGINCVPVSREVIWTWDHASVLRDAPSLILNRDKPQGCWAKVDFFQRGFASGPIIGLDLDIVVLGDIAGLVREDLHMPFTGEQKPAGMGGMGYNGSVYSFTPSESTYRVYPEKIPYRKYPRGEQEYVQNAHGDVKPLPGCYSYKLHVASRYGKTPPPDAVIVYFHGFPTPASVQVQSIGWISATWKGMEKVERK